MQIPCSVYMIENVDVFACADAVCRKGILRSAMRTVPSACLTVRMLLLQERRAGADALVHACAAFNQSRKSGRNSSIRLGSCGNYSNRNNIRSRAISDNTFRDRGRIAGGMRGLPRRSYPQER